MKATRDPDASFASERSTHIMCKTVIARDSALPKDAGTGVSRGEALFCSEVEASSRRHLHAGASVKKHSSFGRAACAPSVSEDGLPLQD